jgi:hypothetical protein
VRASFGITIVVAAALALAGCGGSSGPATRADSGAAGVRAVMRDFLTDFRDGKYTEACALMTDHAKQLLAKGNGSCEGLLLLGSSNVDKPTISKWLDAVDGVKVAVSGSRATTPAIGGSKTITRYVYAGGRWMIDGDVSGGAPAK